MVRRVTSPDSQEPKVSGVDIKTCTTEFSAYIIAIKSRRQTRAIHLVPRHQSIVMVCPLRFVLAGLSAAIVLFLAVDLLWFSGRDELLVPPDVRSASAIISII
jgi:hypothetical protein